MKLTFSQSLARFWNWETAFTMCFIKEFGSNIRFPWRTVHTEKSHIFYTQTKRSYTNKQPYFHFICNSSYLGYQLYISKNYMVGSVDHFVMAKVPEHYQTLPWAFKHYHVKNAPRPQSTNIHIKNLLKFQKKKTSLTGTSNNIRNDL